MAVQTFAIPETVLREQAIKDGMTHLSTGIAVLRGGKILIVRRASDDYLGGDYELPGGGVDEGESLDVSIKRELKEETDLTLSEVLGMFPGFDYATPKKPHVRQFNFLVRADGAVKLSGEHDDAKWVTLQDIDHLPLSGAMKECIINALELTDSFSEQ